MKSILLLPVAILASTAMAQTTSICGANYIVEACLSSEHAKLSACGSQDYECQCNQWQNILTCYNNCPNDSRLHRDAGQRDIFCSYVSQFASSSTTKVSVPSQSVSTPANSTPGADENTTPTDEGSATNTENGAAVNTDDPNNAAGLALNAGSLLAAVAGAVAVVL
ncbi:hypothetical protein VTK26DRAFT_6767 [Humicola hyalothermophila]